MLIQFVNLPKKPCHACQAVSCACNVEMSQMIIDYQKRENEFCGTKKYNEKRMACPIPGRVKSPCNCWELEIEGPITLQDLTPILKIIHY